MKIVQKCALVLAIVLAGSRLEAHVGSADTYYEGDAGPYHLFVTVLLPRVIPGIAEMQVRSASPDVRTIRTVLLRLTGPGSDLPSTPDIAERSKDDPQFFVSKLWLMEYGALKVRIEADGPKGKATLAVPVASFPRQSLTFSPFLQILGMVVLIGLTLGILPVIGGVVREATVPAGETVPASHRRRSRIVMAFTLVATLGVIYANRALWKVEASTYDRSVDLLKPRRVRTTLENGNRLAIRLASPLMFPVAGRGRATREIALNDVIPDHGHLMHMFLVAPRLDRVWHLHPDRDAAGFTQTLPAMPAGHYQLFAEIVDNSGFPWTLVGDVNLPRIVGGTVAGDDSHWLGTPLTSTFAENSVAPLPDGGRLVWERSGGPLKANAPSSFRFRVEDRGGMPVRDLEPYMGMAAHMIVMRSDLGVFAHLHPTGSVPMASLQLAQVGPGGESSSGTSGMPMHMAMMESQTTLPPRFSMPYGMPSAGDYRVAVQIKRSGQVQTAVFDTHVR